MPPCEFRIGPIVMTPPHPQIGEWLSVIGDAIQVSTEHDLLALQTSACLMSTFYEFYEQLTVWTQKQGLSRTSISPFLGSLLHALAVNAEKEGKKGKGFLDLAVESQTPGGLNEQARDELLAHGFFEPLHTAMDNVYKRINPK